MSVFNVLAARHKHLSQLWFTIATAILLGGLAYAAFHVMELSCSGDYWGVKQGQHGSDVSLLALLSHALPNLFLYSIFFVAWGWALKNYRAHWHNLVTNEHRFASLLAIDRIRRDADADIRRELDIQAAVVLLVPSESAYLEAEGEKEITAGERLLRVEETIRGLATHGKAASKKA